MTRIQPIGFASRLWWDFIDPARPHSNAAEGHQHSGGSNDAVPRPRETHALGLAISRYQRTTAAHSVQGELSTGDPPKE